MKRFFILFLLVLCSEMSAQGSKPKLLNRSEVEKLMGYSDVSREKRIQGEVVLKVFVDENGAYSHHTVVKQGHPVLVKTVEEYAHLLKFQPMVVNGQGYPFHVLVPFRFQPYPQQKGK